MAPGMVVFAASAAQMRPTCEARGKARGYVDRRDLSVDAFDHARVCVVHDGREVGRLHAAATEPLGVGAPEVVRRESVDAGASTRRKFASQHLRGVPVFSSVQDDAHARDVVLSSIELLLLG